MAMQGGVGDYSYSRNSNPQAEAFKFFAPGIAEAIHDHPDVFVNETKVIRVVDIGCSSGTNTIKSVDFVVNEVLKASSGEATFEVSFSDLPSNDFNTLFKFLSEKHPQGKPYFYTAVPGSFSENLFPSSAIHFAMSNFALHILSKIPSTPNPGRVVLDDLSSPDAIAAYGKQSHEDLTVFLKHRAEEIVPGGILSCIFLGKVSSDEKSSPWFDFFQEAWEDLVDEGLITQECLDSFNLRTYKRTLNEVKQVIQENESFRAIRVEQIQMESPRAGVLARGLKAVTRPLVSEHFKGDESLTESLYTKIDKKIAAETLASAQSHFTFITFVLIRA